MSQPRLPVTVLSGFLGAGIVWLNLQAKLDKCLVSMLAATRPKSLPQYNDPFPRWRCAESVA